MAYLMLFVALLEGLLIVLYHYTCHNYFGAIGDDETLHFLFFASKVNQ